MLRLLGLTVCVFHACLFPACAQAEQGEAEPCKRLEQSIQGRKHGFLAGNLTYYIGGFHASWESIEEETIGLTHPFFHDLRSRGVGLLNSELAGSEHTGVGNDFRGWEFYKDTRVLYGSVLIGEKVFEYPVPSRMIWRPDKMICEYEIDGVSIREEKFIGANDAALSRISSSKPIVLRFDGQSFFVRHSVSSSASIRYDKQENTIVISEGGTVKSLPDPDRPERFGPCVYQGMTTALSSSKDFSSSIKMNKDDRGVWKYSFEVPCGPEGLTVSWAMNDNSGKAKETCRAAIDQAREIGLAKTAEINRILNRQIPQFRCSDPKFEEIYYFLWSLYLMYYIDVQKGWEMENHTQSAVNNFLGMHRYDACFQIKVGAWTRDKARFAYGNVLTWKHLVENGRYRETPNGLIMLSDNKGIGWHSGAYGGELSEHVLGAWQIYQHTGDIDFIRKCYNAYFKKVFWKGVIDFSMNEAEVGEVLEKMAVLTGNHSDVDHWRNLVRQDKQHIELMFEQRWQANGHENFFMGPRNGMLMTTAFWAMRSKYFPREYAERMIHTWALNRERGFFGEFFPLAMAKKAMSVFSSADDHSFGYTPDTAYFTLDGMFRQGFPKIASDLTLNHLENYNYHDEWDMPVAPEAYTRDLSLFGDQYSNFNAGKILLYLEGLFGLSYSIPDQTLSIRDSMPTNWEWMEMDLPVGNQTDWTKIRIERNDGFLRGLRKTISIQNCPLRLRVEPWLDGKSLSGKASFRGAEFQSSTPQRLGSLAFESDKAVDQCSITIPLK